MIVRALRARLIVLDANNCYSSPTRTRVPTLNRKHKAIKMRGARTTIRYEFILPSKSTATRTIIDNCNRYNFLSIWVRAAREAHSKLASAINNLLGKAIKNIAMKSRLVLIMWLKLMIYIIYLVCNN